MPESREIAEETDWRAKQQSQVAYASEDLKFWGAWDNLLAQSQGHHTIDRLEERGA